MDFYVRSIFVRCGYTCQVHPFQMKNCFQPGSMATPGKLSIQLTVTGSSVDSRTPPMREYKNIRSQIVAHWNNYVPQFVCQLSIVIFRFTKGFDHNTGRWFVINYGRHHTPPPPPALSKCVCVYACVCVCVLIKHCMVMRWFLNLLNPFNQSFIVIFIVCLYRKKAILFYFNMLKCANPAVLINLQCPTTQVREEWCPLQQHIFTLHYVPLQLFLHAWLCKIDGLSH